jgi:DNA helicase-2/ATP-dependent DNA helicase PcrA
MTALLTGRRLDPEPSGTYLRAVLGVEFTPAQLAIATHDLCPQLVVAGAGSGKTMVMAARVVHAVAYQGVEPGRILGLTFTNKAAGELATRVRRSLARLGGMSTAAPATADEYSATEDSADQMSGDDLPTVSTYHSYAASIVRDHALRIGREPYTALLTQATQWQLAMRVVRSATGPFHHLPWMSPAVAGKVIALAGELAEHLAGVDDVRAVDAAVVAAVGALPGRVLKASTECAEAAKTREELLTLVVDYQREKERLDLLDYGDQVALAAEIARRAPAVVRSERERFALVVLDEYQDTGVAQRLLLSTLFGDGHPVTAVGDPNQAIYGWRGASVGNLLRFGSHFPRSDATPVVPQPLMTSFRCGGRILGAANAVAGQIHASQILAGQIHASQILASQIGVAAAPRRRPSLDVPPLGPADGAEDLGRVQIARLATDEDEAAWVSRRLAAELEDGTAAGEMAVLVRRRADFARLHRALVGHGVPVEVVGLGGLLEMPEVADVVATLSLLVEPTANAAAIRLLTGPRWRLGVRDLAALGRRAAHLAVWTPADAGTEPAVSGGLDAALQQVTESVDPVDVAALLDAIESPGSTDQYSPAALDRLAAVAAELRRLRRFVGQPLVELVTEVVRTIGLDVEIEAESERIAIARAANLAAFVDHAARFAGLEGESDLPAFLAFLEASVDAENGLDVGAVSTADTVKLMTVHKAKGLEWDVVAVPGLVTDVFPPNRRRTPWTTGGHVLPYAVRGDSADLPSLDGYDRDSLEAFRQECKADSLDEERRLAYVAFTRPRRLLLASGYCWTRSRINACLASPYLDELRTLGQPAVDIDTWCADPGDGETNPLAALAHRDVPWPTTPDEVAVARRQEAAALVDAAIADAALHPSVPQPAQAADRGTAALAWADEVDLVLGELRRDREAVRVVPLPRRLTASQVVQLARDPGALAQSLARPMPIRPQPQARRGSRFHAWVEQLYSAAPLLEPDDLPGSGDDDLSDAELADLQRRFLDGGWGERRPVAVEQAFELLAGGRLVRGRIDAVYPAAGGGYDVIDYKTGAVPSDFAAASLQLSVYRLAWADLAGVAPEQVDAGFLYVRTGAVKRPERLLSRDELADLLTETPKRAGR